MLILADMYMIRLMRIVGIDPSLTATGVAILEDGEWIALNVLSNKLRGHERMDYILTNMADLFVSLRKGDVVVMEGPSFNSQGQRSHELAGLWWLLRQEMWYYPDITVVIVPPTTRAKYATGKGNAGKDLVYEAVSRDFPDAEIKDHNVADAMIFAAMGARKLGTPIDEREDGSPEMDAFNKVEWPDGI